MCLYKQISAFIFFLMLLMAFPGLAQTDANPVLLKASILKDAGSIRVDYELKNLKKDQIRHLAVTTFLARKTNHSESLGDLPGGGLTHYQCDFDTADLLPGNYLMATRVDFGDQNNQTRRVYQFFPMTVKDGTFKKTSDALDVKLKAPSFNRKSFWQSQGEFALTLKNNLSQPLEPVVVFFLPDGLTVSESEKMYSLKTGEEQKYEIPLKIDSLAGADNPYSIVVWHEADGIHYSQLITGNIRVEESPVYFKWFVVLCSVIIAVLAVIYIFRRRKNAAGT